ncbi:hypothetical protein, partial [Salmonella enterica]
MTWRRAKLLLFKEMAAAKDVYTE